MARFKFCLLMGHHCPVSKVVPTLDKFPKIRRKFKFLIFEQYLLVSFFLFFDFFYKNTEKQDESKTKSNVIMAPTNEIHTI